MHGLIFETSVCYWQNQPGCYLYHADRYYFFGGGSKCQLYFVTIDGINAHEWLLTTYRSSVGDNCAEGGDIQSWLRLLCIGERCFRQGASTCDVTASCLMLSCLGFSLTWVRYLWCVRLREAFLELPSVQRDEHRESYDDLCDVTSSEKWVSWFWYVIVFRRIWNNYELDRQLPSSV